MENKEINSKFDRLISSLKSVSLTDAEKTYIRNVLLNSADDASVRKVKGTRLNHERSILTNLFYKPMPIALMITLLFSGGVSFAAEKSLPGSPLYAVKTEVNERVGEVLAFSTEAKAKFEEKIALRRAGEARKLAENGKMTAEAAAKLNANFEAHSQKFNDHLDKIEAKGNLSLVIEESSNFQAELSSHKTALALLANRAEEDSHKHEILGFLLKLDGESNRARDSREEVETRIKVDASAGVQASAAGKLRAAENKIAEVSRFIVLNKNSVSAEVSARAEAELAVANSEVVNGRAKLEAGAYGEAFVLFNQSFVSAMEAKEMVNRAKNEAELDIRINSDLKVKMGNDAHDAEEADEDDEEADEERHGSDRSDEVSGEGRVKAKANDSEAEADTEVNVEIGL